MPDSCRERLIVFTRCPEPGTAKTRMIPKLGAEGAANLQRRMTEHIMARANKLSALRLLPVEIRYEGGDNKRMTAWLGPGYSYCRQGTGDIGHRMGRALKDAFGQGCKTVVIIGSDIPDITTAIIQRAFEDLKKTDLVLGPAGDGGYYLIGMQRRTFNYWNPQLFNGISWGTEKVLPQTLDIAKRLGLNYILLDTLRDVDRPEDLTVWYQASESIAPLDTRKRISVIIPALNEADIIGESISNLQTSRKTEVIVVDGGSRDKTVEIARSLGAKVLSASPSKATQMNAGAAEAGGDVLLFLHADTRLPQNFEDKILAAVAANGFSAGAFSLGINAQARSLRFIERVANWRSRFFQMPYGDQALFVSRDLFRQIGGFPDYPIMEDFELVRRLKRRGKIAILPESVRTSPRRWLNFGIFKTWLLNQIIIVAYYLGVSPQRLSQWYHREKGTAEMNKPGAE